MTTTNLRRFILPLLLGALLASCGRGPGTPSDADGLAPVPHPGSPPTEAPPPSGWTGAAEPVIDWDKYQEPEDEDDAGSGSSGSGSYSGDTSTCSGVNAALASGISVLYTGQCHSRDWSYYTKDARTRGNSGGVTVHPNIVDGRENGSFICGHDNDMPLADGRYCSANAEWAAVGGS